MQNLMIYPYDDEFCPILKYREFLPEYHITRVVSLMGWGFCGKDAGITNKRSQLGFTVTGDFMEGLSQCDTVLFCESRTVDFDKIIMPKVELAIHYKKNIILTLKLPEDKLNKLSDQCRKHNVDFKYYCNNIHMKNYENIELLDESVLEIGVPVLFVFGTCQKTNKFEIQLSLRKQFMDKGYRVSQIGSRNYCELLGFHSLPVFMYSAQHEYSKIILLNRYIKEIELSENPDVIIIGIPGGIMPFNNKFTNKFGMLAYEISQAVTPDVSVFSSLYNEYNKEYFELLSDNIKHRYGYSVDCFNLSNHIFNWDDSEYQQKEIFITVHSSLVDERLKEYDGFDIMTCNILNDESCARMAQLLIDRLTKYAEIECV